MAHISLGEAIERAHRMADEQESAKKAKPKASEWTPAKGKPPRKPNMNKLEARYAAHLELRKQQGEILEWWREPVRLRLANLKEEPERIEGRKDVFYKPDFGLMLPDYTVEYHETKGRMHRDALNHIKLAAKLHPFRFVVVTKPSKSTGWQYEWYGGPDERDDS